jgi:hypothetical protein
VSNFQTHFRSSKRGEHINKIGDEVPGHCDFHYTLVDEPEGFEAFCTKRQLGVRQEGISSEGS